MLQIKPFQETLNAHMCGPASVKMVFNYYGIEKTEKEIAQLADMVPDLGIDERGIEKVARSLGFKIDVKNESTFGDIDKWLKKGVPVIVDWFTRGRSDYSDSAVADGHYSVVVELDGQHIYLQDPEIGGIRKIKRDDFLLVWFDFKGYQIKPDELIIRQLIAIYK